MAWKNFDSSLLCSFFTTYVYIYMSFFWYIHSKNSFLLDITEILVIINYSIREDLTKVMALSSYDYARISKSNDVVIITKCKKKSISLPSLVVDPSFILFVGLNDLVNVSKWTEIENSRLSYEVLRILGVLSRFLYDQYCA